MKKLALLIASAFYAISTVVVLAGAGPAVNGSSLLYAHCVCSNEQVQNTGHSEDCGAAVMALSATAQPAATRMGRFSPITFHALQSRVLGSGLLTDQIKQPDAALRTARPPALPVYILHCVYRI